MIEKLIAKLLNQPILRLELLRVAELVQVRAVLIDGRATDVV